MLLKQWLFNHRNHQEEKLFVQDSLQKSCANTPFSNVEDPVFSDHLCGVGGATLKIGTMEVTITLMLTLSTLRAPMAHVFLVTIAQVTISTLSLAWGASGPGPR